jgi:hypothetical protein
MTPLPNFFDSIKLKGKMPNICEVEVGQVTVIISCCSPSHVENKKY